MSIIEGYKLISFGYLGRKNRAGEITESEKKTTMHRGKKTERVGKIERKKIKARGKLEGGEKLRASTEHNTGKKYSEGIVKRGKLRARKRGTFALLGCSSTGWD